MSTKDFIEKDFYKILGVSKDADAATIKKAYRKLAKDLHPDVNKGNAENEERFKDVSEAYDVLSDAKRRAEYDEARTLFGSGGFRGGPGGFNPNDLFGNVNFGNGNFGTGNFGNSDFGDLGDVLGGIFNRGRGQRAPRRGADLETEVTLSFTDALHGATVPLRLASAGPCETCRGTGSASGKQPEPCPTCGASGQVGRDVGGFAFSDPCRDCKGRGLIVSDPCAVCRGSGRGQSSRTVQARIPAGVKNGARIRLKGKGVAGERGGPAGDLYVEVHVLTHEIFGRADDNLTITVPISFVEAVNGADIKVPVLEGTPVTIRIPAGTKTGAKFRARGKGVMRKDGKAGDLIVSVEIVVPTDLTIDAQDALAKFAEATAQVDPRADLLSKAGEGVTHAE